MFKITIEGNGDHATVTSEVEHEKLISICSALAVAIEDVSKIADISARELILYIKRFISLHETMR